MAKMGDEDDVELRPIMTPDTPSSSRNRANMSLPRASQEKMTSAVGSAAQTSDQRAAFAPNAAHGWIARLIKKEGPGILRMLWRLLGSEADVMDAYQDCFCKLAGRKNHGDVKNAKAYAYRTASNIAVEMIRTRTRHRAHWATIVAERGRTQEVNNEPDQHEERNRFDPLRDAISALPAHLRNVILLRDLSRLSYQEVGRMLGIDPATARVYRRHAVVKLAGILEPGSKS